MRVRTVGNQGLIPRGTFREHFTFHSWQAEMGCQTAFLERSRFADAPCTVAGYEAEDTLEQDAQLVQQCLQGDGSAWEELVRRHSRRIFNICYRLTGNRTESQDLSQDVFLRVYRTLGSYRSAHGGC